MLSSHNGAHTTRNERCKLSNENSERYKTNLREQAYGNFTEHLLNRELRSGQFISQRELVELTGLKLGAIRELVPRLETEGLITTVPKRGMQIAHVDLNLIRDAFQLRLFLEVEAIQIFARDARDATIAAFRAEHDEILDECHRAQENGGIPASLVDKAQTIDWALHDTIIDQLGNKIVADAYRVNSIKIRLIKQEQTRLNDRLVISTMQEHMRIIEALEARDADAAARAMREHIHCAQARAVNHG